MSLLFRFYYVKAYIHSRYFATRKEIVENISANMNSLRKFTTLMFSFSLRENRKRLSFDLFVFTT